MGRRAIRLASFLVGAGLAVVVLATLTIQKAPTPVLADRIDRLLERDACVGQVESWPSRRYSWGWTRWTSLPGLSRWFGSDTSEIDILFYRGGTSPEFYPPGRRLLRADQVLLVYDSSDSWFVFATYDVEAHRLTELSCGPNYPEEEPAA